MKRKVKRVRTKTANEIRKGKRPAPIAVRWNEELQTWEDNDIFSPMYWMKRPEAPHPFFRPSADRINLPLKFDSRYPGLERAPDPRLFGIGGAPTRATSFPADSEGRKQRPVATGVLDYFPDALVAISELSYKGNAKHNPGQLLHWARGKSSDEADTLIRHFLQRGTIDAEDGIRHSVKVAWRALAMLQKEIEDEQRISQSGR